MNIIIIGGGDIGTELAANLSAKKQNVVLIDKDPAKVKNLSQKLGILVIEKKLKLKRLRWLLQ
ncbi:NAD-binding protein [Dethiobacter alkaliphilus]|uniref:BRCT domain-containing protein n=1 Tax=Dethiobacter alkaliphilus AHT 1 TaxID=555088 RepID=C0GHH4_DETAL|nr:NAD-binding protein [Dethiobacter alkaliphilus]EEG77180.1 hypothetical protein DealDRAFT_1933 [Dethiobacter alkaliphilus AHT 1]